MVATMVSCYNIWSVLSRSTIMLASLHNNTKSNIANNKTYNKHSNIVYIRIHNTYSNMVIFEVGEFGRKRPVLYPVKGLNMHCSWFKGTMPDLNDIYVLRDGQVAAPMFALLCHLTSECCPAAGARRGDWVQMQSNADSLPSRATDQSKKQSFRLFCHFQVYFESERKI
jgi:hypothetical protein